MLGFLDQQGEFHGVPIEDGITDAYEAVQLLAEKFESIQQFEQHIVSLKDTEWAPTLNEFLEGTDPELTGYWVLSPFPYTEEHLRNEMAADIEYSRPGSNFDHFVGVYLDDLGRGPADSGRKFILEGYENLPQGN